MSLHAIIKNCNSFQMILAGFRQLTALETFNYDVIFDSSWPFFPSINWFFFKKTVSLKEAISSKEGSWGKNFFHIAQGTTKSRVSILTLYPDILMLNSNLPFYMSSSFILPFLEMNFLSFSVGMWSFLRHLLWIGRKCSYYRERWKQDG